MQQSSTRFRSVSVCGHVYAILQVVVAEAQRRCCCIDKSREFDWSAICSWCKARQPCIRVTQCCCRSGRDDRSPHDEGCEHDTSCSLSDADVSYVQVFGYIYSDDEAVVVLVSKVMPLVASFQVRLQSTPMPQSLITVCRSLMDWRVRVAGSFEDRVCGHSRWSSTRRLTDSVHRSTTSWRLVQSHRVLCVGAATRHYTSFPSQNTPWSPRFMDWYASP